MLAVSAWSILIIGSCALSMFLWCVVVGIRILGESSKSGEPVHFRRCGLSLLAIRSGCITLTSRPTTEGESGTGIVGVRGGGISWHTILLREASLFVLISGPVLILSRCLKVGPSFTKKYSFDHCIIILRRQIYRRVELMFLVTILMVCRHTHYKCLKFLNQVTDRYY